MKSGPSPLRLLALLVLVLSVVWAVRRTAESTVVRFTVEADGEPVPLAQVTVSGQPFTSGDRLWPGWRAVGVTGDTLVPLQLRRWVGPGGNDWGVLATRHRRGRVEVTATPTPLRLRLGEGAQAAEAAGSATLTATPVIGPHPLTAIYPTFTNHAVVTVEEGRTVTVAHRVDAGWVEAKAEPDGITAELWQGRRLLLTGDAGRVFGPVPAGDYEVVFRRGQERATNAVTVTPLTTNAVRHRFIYGRAEFVSVPPGATVVLDGREVGTTPLTRGELALGPHRVRFRHPDLAPEEREFTFVGDQEERLEVRLRRREAVQLWENARQAAQFGNLPAALRDTAAALKLEPDWTELSGRQREWTLALGLRTAKSALERGDFDAVTTALAEVTQLDPENATAKLLRQNLDAAKERKTQARVNDDFGQKLAQAQRALSGGRLAQALVDVDAALTLKPEDAAARQLRDNVLASQGKAEVARREQAVRDGFAVIKGKLADRQLFADGEWRFPGTIDTVWPALMQSLRRPRNEWTLVNHAKTTNGVFYAQLQMRGGFKPTKEGVVLLGPIKDGEVLVLGSFLEYVLSDDLKYVPVHPDYWHRENPLDAKERRQETLDLFERALKQELGKP
jgi:hypothetical protein